MDSDIPLPEGTPRSSHSRDANSVPQEIKPMEAPDQNDEMFRELQEQAKQHVQATTSSPASDQLQQLAMAQYNPGVAAIPQVCCMSKHNHEFCSTFCTLPHLSL